jgi:hypothetical protein
MSVGAVISERTRAALEAPRRADSLETVHQPVRFEAKEDRLIAGKVCLIRWCAPSGPSVQVSTQENTPLVTVVIEQRADLGQRAVHGGIAHLV